MAFVEILSTEVDKKSPVDESLMGKIKSDLDDLDSRIQASGAFDFVFRVLGYLEGLRNPTSGVFARRNRLDGGYLSKAATLQACRIMLKDGGTGGDIEVDVRKGTKPDCEIQAITSIFRASIQSIARAGSAINTQSISRAASQINTQSISRWKSTLNIGSITDLGTTNATGTHYFKLNLTSAPDADYLGQSIVVASTTGGTNDGTFTVVRVKEDGGNNLVIANGSGAAQAGAAGTVELNLWKYVYSNPVDSHFAALETVLMASHTNAANDGSLEIYAINQGGNNIIVRNNSGVAQAGVAGTADCRRWKFVTSSAVSTTDYVVGESALLASHTSANNDGTFAIKAVNDGGNNIVIYNESGVVQGGTAGTINTQRWVYAFSADPSANVTAGDQVFVASASTGANNGLFTVKEVNRSAGNNFVVANNSGASQGGAAGTAYSALKKVKFAASQANITTDSRILIVNAPSVPEGDYDVSEINRGGGSNYNAIISITTAFTEQDGNGGRVALETKSVFDTRPKYTVPPRTLDWHATHYDISSNAVFNSSRKVIAGDTPVFLDLINVPTDARDLVVQLL